MIAYLKLAKTNPGLLDSKLMAIGNDDMMTQNITPLYRLELGKEYTVKEVITNMIIYSDNIASNTLLENINPEDLQSIYSNLNIVMPTELNAENYMSVREYSSFFRILYNASYLNKEMSEQALKIMSLSQYKQGLRASIPANIVISHKFGERTIAETQQLHDCGIVYKKDKPYLLCIMTRGLNYDNMSTAIKELSNLVYKKFN